MYYSRTKDWHHVYPKRHRNGECETKLVNSRDHKAWHAICRDLHPYEAMQKIHSVIFAKPYLSRSEQIALGILMGKRTKESCYKYCCDNFLPTVLLHQLNMVETSEKCFTHIQEEKQTLPTL